jgi:hypothetical protein
VVLCISAIDEVLSALMRTFPRIGLCRSKQYLPDDKATNRWLHNYGRLQSAQFLIHIRLTEQALKPHQPPWSNAIRKQSLQSLDIPELRNRVVDML